jgi:hypothetical protein
LAEVIENPILDSPYREPTGHFHVDRDGSTSAFAEGPGLDRGASNARTCARGRHGIGSVCQ